MIVYNLEVLAETWKHYRKKKFESDVIVLKLVLYANNLKFKTFKTLPGKLRSGLPTTE